MNIKPLPKTPRLPTQVEDGGTFIKALYNTFIEISAAVNAILASLQKNAWEAPALLNSWANYGAGAPPAGYLLDASGFVHLRGAVKEGSGTIFTLPPGYRPAYPVAAVGMSASNTACRIDVATDGNVTVGGESNTFVSLDGITFKAATE